jgi:hypothetical protein
MDAGETLRALAEAEDLPKDALQAATARRAEMIPLFLAAIERFLTAPAKERAEPTALFYIFHLVGSWREKSAYRPLARFLRCAQVDDILGDATTIASHRVMAAIFDGDPQPLYDIILDPVADEFARSRMCETLAILVLRGELDRHEVVRFLGDAFGKINPRSRCYVWQGWQSAVAMLGASELKSLVKQAFDREYVDRTWLGFQDFEKDIEFAIEHPGKSRLDNDGLYTLFGDTIEELSTWYGFSEKYKEDRRRWERNADEDILVSEPYINQFRNIGRNDPCPCGSGR